MAITSETLDLAALLQAAEDDTNEAPWMTVPEFQYFVAYLLVGILRLHTQRQRLGWHVGGELGVIMPKPEGGTLTLGPDVFVVEADDELRSSWDIRREGRPPTLVLEVVTTDSVERDTAAEQKPAYYAAMGVAEYVIYWPYRADGGPRLFGYRRDGQGRWRTWTTDATGILWSAALGGLGLVAVEQPWLRVVDQEGRMLPSLEEEAEQTAAARERAVQEQRRAEEARLREEEARLRADQAVELAQREGERAEREAARGRLRKPSWRGYARCWRVTATLRATHGLASGVPSDDHAPVATNRTGGRLGRLRMRRCPQLPGYALRRTIAFTERRHIVTHARLPTNQASRPTPFHHVAVPTRSTRWLVARRCSNSWAGSPLGDARSGQSSSNGARTKARSQRRGCGSWRSGRVDTRSS
jgi:Uma2 family endonuclease